MWNSVYFAAWFALALITTEAQTHARSCPPRGDYDSAVTWIESHLSCERHKTPSSTWIEWGEYCPDGELGYFVLKVQGGTSHLFERMPPGLWEGFKTAASANQYYKRAINGLQYQYRLRDELSPTAPELLCLDEAAQ